MNSTATMHFDSTTVRGLRVSVIGAARSGLSVSRLLVSAGASVRVSERNAPVEGQLAAFERLGVSTEFGGHTERIVDADLVVVSPGVPTDSKPVTEALKAGIPVRSELEVASWFCRAPIVAVTGSNGKTTTTTLLGHIFRTSGRTTWVAGNIGTPFSDVAALAEPDDVVVLEVSSFQLDHVDRFRPDVALMLNITPDHLDRYGNDEARYAAAKLRLSARQGPTDTLVYNRDDVRLAAFAASLSSSGPICRAVSLDSTAGAAAFVRDGTLVLSINDNEEELMRADDLALRGRHNLYNSLAAAVAARVLEVRSDVVRASLTSFEGVPHRLELVREIDGIKYVNDSKATNVNAVWYALESIREPIVLIAGGRDKGNDYGPLKPLVKDRVKALIAIGESAGKVESELGDCVPQVFRARSMEDAVEISRLVARNGDVVLLSPACASFDQFENFEDRGDSFRRLVASL